jgi:hypothetical protein
MSGEKAHGNEGERIVDRLLRYERWGIIERQSRIFGHTLDMLAEHPLHGEALIEVKVWADPKTVGTDNVKKAIADAYDLRAAGETRPYILVLSHELPGLLKDMLQRAVDVGAITEVRVLALNVIMGGLP